MYYNPQGGHSTGSGQYYNTAATGNISGYDRRASRGYGSPQGGYGAQRQNRGYNPYGNPQQPYQQQQGQQYNNPYGGGGGYAGQGASSYIPQRGNAPQNPFRGGGGGWGGGMGMGGGMFGGRQGGQQQQQQSPYDAWDQRMQQVPGMQQGFAAMGFDPAQQQQYFQDYLYPSLDALMGRNTMLEQQRRSDNNPFIAPGS